MAISPHCDVNVSSSCEGELRQFGAILFGPPYEDHNGVGGMVTRKLHVCVPCWKVITTGTEASGG